MTPRDIDPWRNEPASPRWGCGAVAIMFIVLLVGGGMVAWHHLTNIEGAAEAEVTAASGRLTLELDDGDHRGDFDRRTSPEVWYRVMLENVPPGRALQLNGEWTDSQGRIVHRNQYQTKMITHVPWQTHVRCRLSPASPLGVWHVRLLLNGRQLHSVSFEVHDGDD